MIDAQAIAAARALADSNAREAVDLVGHLTLLLDRLDESPQHLATARMVCRRLADRLTQGCTLERLGSGANWRPDAWSPAELVEELELEARSLASGRIEISIGAPDLAPQYWLFDRELVLGALSDVLHAALRHAVRHVRIEFGMREGFLGFSVCDDSGAYPEELFVDDVACIRRGELNGNAIGIHFARIVAGMHADGQRRGRVDLENLPGDAGTRFTLWLP